MIEKQEKSNIIELGKKPGFFLWRILHGVYRFVQDILSSALTNQNQIQSQYFTQSEMGFSSIKIYTILFFDPEFEKCRSGLTSIVFRS